MPSWSSLPENLPTPHPTFFFLCGDPVSNVAEPLVLEVDGDLLDHG